MQHRFTYLEGPGAVVSVASFFGLAGREESLDLPFPFATDGTAVELPQPLAHPRPRMLLSRLLEGAGETTDMGGGTASRSTVGSSSGLPNASGLEPPPPVSEAVPLPLDPLMLL